MHINNKVYDVLKYLSVIALPALGTFWMVVGAVWGVPHVDEVVKTIVALATLLGALLVLSTVQYNNSDRPYDGTLDVEVTPEDTDNLIRHMDLKGSVNDITDSGKVTLKVRPKG